ncbi:FAD dependent oxidoreductase [gut metagenome]|uniref:FAD dependent oxidoreductase n=1 Tax=gut metagenome TaxID=749906 RepID=J9CBG8_9ZZZZ
MKYDVVIIGGGLGGLECAYLLARQGQRVLVLEQGAVPGGCLQSYCRHHLSFDTGFHYVGGLDEGQSLYAAFKYLGLLDLPWHRLDADGFDRVTIGNRTFSFAEGFESFASRLGDDFPSERVAIRHYAELLRLSSMQQLVSLHPHAERLQFSPGVPSPAELLETGAWTYLNEHFHDPLLIQVLSGTSLKMELRKESLPLFTFLHGNAGYIESSWRLKGDGSLMVHALVDHIQDQGGVVLCHAKVEQLVVKNGKITAAVCANGERYEGDWFISDVHPAQTCAWVQPAQAVKPAYVHRINSLENTFGMFTVSLRIQPHTLRYFNYNHYLYRQPNVWDFYQDTTCTGGLLISCRVPENGSEYTSQVDLLCPMSWQSCQAWEKTRVGRRGGDYKRMKQRKTQECIELAERVLPGLRRFSHGYTSTPITWRDYTFTPQGSAYGIRKDFRNPLLTMLSPRTPIPNLLLTGQNLWLHGVHGVTLTAFHTCAVLLGKEAIWEMIGNDINQDFKII